MCLIINNIAGAKLAEYELKNAYNGNNDGYGFIGIDKKGEIYHHQSMSDSFDKFMKDYKSFLNCKWAACHLRLATHGLKNTDNCHPIVRAGGKVSIMHNGMLDIHELDSTKSDTAHLADIVEDMYLGRCKEEHIHGVVEGFCGNSNRIILQIEDRIKIFGQWIKRNEGSLSNSYSLNSYKPARWKEDLDLENEWYYSSRDKTWESPRSAGSYLGTPHKVQKYLIPSVKSFSEAIKERGGTHDPIIVSEVQWAETCRSSLPIGTLVRNHMGLRVLGNAIVNDDNSITNVWYGEAQGGSFEIQHKVKKAKDPSIEVDVIANQIVEGLIECGYIGEEEADAQCEVYNSLCKLELSTLYYGHNLLKEGDETKVALYFEDILAF